VHVGPRGAQDLIKDGRASLTVAAKSFKGAADGRVNLVGDVARVPKAEVDALKATYREKHPGACESSLSVSFLRFVLFPPCRAARDAPHPGACGAISRPCLVGGIERRALASRRARVPPRSRPAGRDRPCAPAAPRSDDGCALGRLSVETQCAMRSAP
jgi:hypothetical protein